MVTIATTHSNACLADAPHPLMNSNNKQIKKKKTAYTQNHNFYQIYNDWLLFIDMISVKRPFVEGVFSVNDLEQFKCKLILITDQIWWLQMSILNVFTFIQIWSKTKKLKDSLSDCNINDVEILY